MEREFYEKEADISDYFNVFKYTAETRGLAHFHDSAEFFFVEKGSAAALIDGEKWELCEGDVGAVRPYQVHSFEYHADSVVYAVVIGGGYLKDFRKKYRGFFDPRLPKDEDAYGKLKALFAFAETLKPFRFLAKQGLCDLFLDVLAERFPVTAKNELKRKNFSDVLIYIEKNFKTPLALRQVAAGAGYSPAYFSALFFKYTRLHFHDYVNLVRYRHAEKLLSEDAGGLTVAAAAFECGFESVNTFYRAKHKFSKS